MYRHAALETAIHATHLARHAEIMSVLACAVKCVLAGCGSVAIAATTKDAASMTFAVKGKDFSA